MIMWVKNANNFQIAKVQPKLLLSICLFFFCQFQPDVAYNSVAYKKSAYLDNFLHECLHGFP